MNRVVLHLDMNAFFASVEQQSNPSLRGKPIAVCGRGRTVVATCSYEARRYGVRTGMSLSQAGKLCPSIIPVEGNHMKYIDTARRIHRICLEYTDRVEVFSIDEVFMEITEVLNRFGGPGEIACSIKGRIKTELGLNCSIGIASNKLLAKLASDMEKPDGLVIINEEDISFLLEQTPVEKLCGIGSKTKKKLNSLGIMTLKELALADESMMRVNFGFMGSILVRMGSGQYNSPVSRYEDHVPVKSVGHSNTLPSDTLDMDIIRSFLLMLAERVGMRLRNYGIAGDTVSTHIRYSDFRDCSRQKRIGFETDSGKDIYLQSLSMIRKMQPFRRPVRLLGVTVSGIKDNRGQLYMLDNFMKEQEIYRAVDTLNSRFGEFTVRPLAFEIARKFNRRSVDIPARVHGFIHRSDGRRID